MANLFSRRAILTALACGVASVGWANAPAVSLRPVARPQGVRKAAVADAGALIEKARLGGRVAFSVIDAKSGLVLEQTEATTGLPPASVTKTITALYALEVLGAGHRFATRLIASGAVTNGVLRGDLVLAGGGDPALDTDGLARLAAKLKAAGIREVTGRLRAYGGALPRVRQIDPAQPDFVAYNPSISGLNLNFNRVHFEWKRAGGKYTTTMDARSGKYRPEVRIARMSIAEQAQPVFLYKDGGAQDLWSVSRRALGNAGARWLPVRKPEAYAVEVFAMFARSQGIVLKPGAPLDAAPSGPVLATEQSAPLRDILRDMLKFSNNMTAETVGLSATLARQGKVTSLSASAQEMTRWARTRLGMAGARFVDHSGLGEAARVTAADLAGAMAAVDRQGTLKPLLKPFVLRDQNGAENKTHPIKVLAKTGTLYFVSTLTGYMTAPDGRELAFAILAADDGRRAKFDSKTGARPEGAAAWNKRAKRLQQDLIERWGAIYGS